MSSNVQAHISTKTQESLKKKVQHSRMESHAASQPCSPHAGCRPVAAFGLEPPVLSCTVAKDFAHADGKDYGYAVKQVGTEKQQITMCLKMCVGLRKENGYRESEKNIIY